MWGYGIMRLGFVALSAKLDSKFEKREGAESAGELVVIVEFHGNERSHVSFSAQNDALKLLLSLAKLAVSKKLSSGVEASVLKEMDECCQQEVSTGELRRDIRSWLAEKFDFLFVAGEDVVGGSTGQLELHGHAVRVAMDGDILVGNGLINMNTKCGSLDKGCLIFEKMGFVVLLRIRFGVRFSFHPLQQHHTRTPLSLLLTRRHLPSQTTLTPLSFQSSDFDRAKSPETWKDACRNTNDGFERLVFESRKANDGSNCDCCFLRLNSLNLMCVERIVRFDLIVESEVPRGIHHFCCRSECNAALRPKITHVHEHEFIQGHFIGVDENSTLMGWVLVSLAVCRGLLAAECQWVAYIFLDSINPFHSGACDL
ncbi:hypothetical protein Droror1_Dr00002278 [Drosera rotundifolia]